MSVDKRDPAIIAFEHVRSEWMMFYNNVRAYLHNLDGDLSRSIGHVVQIVIDADKSGEADKNDWQTIATAKFLFNDPELWHELANSRKQ